MPETSAVRLEIRAVGMSDVGRKRKLNEDTFAAADNLGLYVVADGMGGHAAGEVASRLAVESIERHMAGLPTGDATAPSDISSPAFDQSLPAPARKVIAAIRMANQEIVRSVRHDASMRGMGTTVVMAYIQGRRVYIGSVGDSRAYLVRDDEITQLTDDHTFVNEQVRAGTLTAAEARRHPARNILTRAVGSSDDVDADVVEHDLEAGDLILLCSDGLTTMIDDEDILQVVRRQGNDPQRACRALIDLANDRGGDDNITAILIQARSSARSA
ncbi:MAG TPA: Stp1/IreP family PP2C-type Ser/Thr phosphatase [Candidatus Polarisedimenticolia bacterium]|nr:Stp1/IreP family PP2C-type Ser/Thr phosphatase [Candidatus Polarisedimenticolia bacterium]